MWGEGMTMIVAPDMAFATVDLNIIIPALVTALAAVVGSYYAYRAIKQKPSSDKPQDGDDVPVKVETSPLANFSGTYTDFARMVVDENENQRTRLANLENDIKSIRIALDATKDELVNTQRNHTVFEDAVRRYLKVIAEYIEQLGGIMPGPDTTDIPILDRTLPNRHVQ